MNFREFEKRIVKVNKMKLPGQEVQLKMAPMSRLEVLSAKNKDEKKWNQAGVMALFYPTSTDQTNLILILRKTYKGVHSAQVGFPGGRLEPEDSSIMAAALRETEEEVGVSRNDILVLKRLTEIYIPPSNFFVQPFMGITTLHPSFIPQEDEVEALIEVSLPDFMNDKNIVKEILTTSYMEELEVPAFKLNGHIVWGATAMMLNEVREMLKRLL